jgi:hypothetical protein
MKQLFQRARCSKATETKKKRESLIVWRLVDSLTKHRVAGKIPFAIKQPESTPAVIQAYPFRITVMDTRFFNGCRNTTIAELLHLCNKQLLSSTIMNKNDHRKRLNM